MSVRKQKRRKITCNDKEYIWYIKPDEDCFDKFVLHIISDDKRLIILYVINSDYIVSIGREFQSRKSSGRWERYKLPFEKIQFVTPKFVSQLIEWAENGKSADSVSWNGSNIWL